jgi:hypothetical protein
MAWAQEDALNAKRIAHRVLPRRVYNAVREIVSAPRLAAIERRLEWTNAALARHLYGLAPTTPRDHELSVHSQNGEDGILLHLFSVIGTTDRRFVEFGMGDGITCNTANLSRNWGWGGLLMDAEDFRVARARRTYGQWGLGERVAIRRRFVTAENIDATLREAGFADTWDLLSIDIDGNDYWVWNAIHGQPRLVVIEYNSSFGPDRAVTIPYDPSFDRFRYHPSGIYHGASIAALAKLGAPKGYALVGGDSNGVNAFFVRVDLLTTELVEVPAQAAWAPSAERTMPQAEQEAILASFPTVEL